MEYTYTCSTSMVHYKWVAGGKESKDVWPATEKLCVLATAAICHILGHGESKNC